MININKFFCKKPVKEIKQILKNKKLENVILINKIESELIKRRGFIFKMPKEGESVILMWSGGLDTTIILDILLRIYKLQVYPLFVRRGQIRVIQEEESVNFFTKYYYRKYPRLFKFPQKITTFIPPLPIRWTITKFGSVRINEKMEALGIPMYASIMTDIAVQYAYYIFLNKAILPTTIFFGYVADDGVHTAYETLTSLRINNFKTIYLTNNYNFQISALPIEKELGFHFGKEELIKYASYFKIPIEKTYSCIKYNTIHCGICIYCKSRQRCFKNAGVKDKTKYLNKYRKTFFLLDRILLFLKAIKFIIKIFYEQSFYYFYFLKRRW